MEIKREKDLGFAVHPGRILGRELVARGMSHAELAVRAGTTEKTISQIINGYSPISMDMAIKLEYVLGIPAHVWNNLQMNYQEVLLKRRAIELQEKETEYIRAFNYADLRKIAAFLPNTRKVGEKIEALRRMFGVSSLASIFDTDVGKYLACARRSSAESIGKEPNKYALVSWLRIGENIAQNVHCNEFNLQKLRGELCNIKKTICNLNFSEAWDQIEAILGNCGIKLVAVPYLKNTYVNGAVRWIGDNPVIIMSNRNAYLDIFWFSLMHEICHVIKHGKKYACVAFEESIKCYTKSNEEVEADQFAADYFIPESEIAEFVSNFPHPTLGTIEMFASRCGIPSYMVIGRLGHMGVIKWSDEIANSRPKVPIASV